MISNVEFHCVLRRRWNFVSHVGVSPKLSGWSSPFLLPLAGSRAVRVFSSAGAQTRAACCFFSLSLKKQSKQSVILPLSSQIAQTIGFAWCFVSPKTDVKWPRSQVSADLMLRPSDRDRVKTSPPRIHSTDPAHPMNRAAPSSNLFTRGLRWGARGVCLSSYFTCSFLLLIFLIQKLTSEQRRAGRRSRSWFCERKWSTQSCNTGLQSQVYLNLKIWNLKVHRWIL